MGNKTVMVLVIPEPKVRKTTAKAERPHKDKTKYTRKVKHKAPDWGLFIWCKMLENNKFYLSKCVRMW